MIKNFGGGYYQAEMNIQSYEGGPSIDAITYNNIAENLYDDDVPILMKIGLSGSEVFEPEPEGGIPKNVLATPDSFYSSNRDKEDIPILLLKPEIAKLYV